MKDIISFLSWCFTDGVFRSAHVVQRLFDSPSVQGYCWGGYCSGSATGYSHSYS